MDQVQCGNCGCKHIINLTPPIEVTALRRGGGKYKLRRGVCRNCGTQVTIRIPMVDGEVVDGSDYPAVES